MNLELLFPYSFVITNIFSRKKFIIKEE